MLELALESRWAFLEHVDAGVAWRDQAERDAVGFAGCEAARRVIGIGRIDDLDTLAPEVRDAACEVVLRTAHRWVGGYGVGLEDAVARFAG